MLHFAALDERANVVDLLLTNGADPLAGDQEGTTALHVSAKLANIKITRLLVDHDRMGADVLSQFGPARITGPPLAPPCGPSLNRLPHLRQ